MLSYEKPPAGVVDLGVPRSSRGGGTTCFIS
jgi:hypothetical protein